MATVTAAADPATVGLDALRLGRVAARIDSDIDAGRYDGAALVAARHGQVVLDLYAGFADRAAGRTLDRDAVFPIFSVSKALTATVALKLVEDGVFRLTTPISAVIPEFGRAGKQHVNVFHILTHTSGIPRSTPGATPDVIASLERFAAWTFEKPPEARPGERLAYSTMVAHSVLGLFMERASGRPFARLMQEELFDPLGMVDTSFSPRDDLMPRRCPSRWAHGILAAADPEFAWRLGDLDAMETAFLTPGSLVPGAGAMSTPRDLHRFAEMLRRGGELDGARILSPAMIDRANRNYTGDFRNPAADWFFETHRWLEVPGYLGLGYWLRGEQIRPGPFGVLNSPRAFGGIGFGGMFLWVDPVVDMTFVFISTGVMEEGDSWERHSVLSDLVLSSVTDRTPFA